jgi:uncharacterized protein (TIGR00369 family)
MSAGVADIDPRCLESFERPGMMKLIGAKLVAAGDGRAVIEVPYREDLTQQHGYFHGGIVATIGDSACGYAAYTTMPDDASVLTVEFKINLVNPAAGELLRAEAEVRKTGRTLVVASATVSAIKGDKKVACAELLGTFICLQNTSDAEPRKSN